MNQIFYSNLSFTDKMVESLNLRLNISDFGNFEKFRKIASFSLVVELTRGAKNRGVIQQVKHAHKLKIVKFRVN